MVRNFFEQNTYIGTNNWIVGTYRNKLKSTLSDEIVCTISGFFGTLNVSDFTVSPHLLSFDILSNSISHYPHKSVLFKKNLQFSTLFSNFNQKGIIYTLPNIII